MARRHGDPPRHGDRRGRHAAPRRRPDARRGAIAVLTLVFVLIMASMMAASFLIGRAITARDELQAAADSMARAAAMVSQVSGVANGRRLANYVGAVAGNFGGVLVAPPALAVADDASGDFLNVDVAVTTQVGSDSSGLTGDILSIPVTSSARARVHQAILDDVQRIVPKMVLTLDYSDSMRVNFGGGRTRIQALRDAINGLLDLNLEIDYALVLFGTGVRHTVAFAPGNVAAIRAGVARATLGETYTGQALQQARTLLQTQPAEERYVLLVSDGTPTDPVNPVPVSDDLRNNQVTSVFSFEIKTAGAGALEALMRRVAGRWVERDPDTGAIIDGDPVGDNPRYYLSVDNTAVLVDTFRGMTSRIQCRGGPLSPLPTPDAAGEFRVFGVMRSRASGAEIATAVTYEPDTGTVVLLRPLHCDWIRDASHFLVVRWDHPRLVQ